MLKIKRSLAIDLCNSMIKRYKNILQNIKNNSTCPVCKTFDTNLKDRTNCISCFNRVSTVSAFDYVCACMWFKTIDDDILRLEYWEKVLKYLQSITSDFVQINKLRDKCNEIDNQLI